MKYTYPLITISDKLNFLYTFYDEFEEGNEEELNFKYTDTLNELGYQDFIEYIYSLSKSNKIKKPQRLISTMEYIDLFSFKGEHKVGAKKILDLIPFYKEKLSKEINTRINVFDKLTLLSFEINEIDKSDKYWFDFNKRFVEMYSSPYQQYEEDLKINQDVYKMLVNHYNPKFVELDIISFLETKVLDLYSGLLEFFRKDTCTFMEIVNSNDLLKNIIKIEKKDISINYRLNGFIYKLDSENLSRLVISDNYNQNKILSIYKKAFDYSKIDYIGTNNLKALIIDKFYFASDQHYKKYLDNSSINTYKRIELVDNDKLEFILHLNKYLIFKKILNSSDRQLTKFIRQSFLCNVKEESIRYHLKKFQEKQFFKTHKEFLIKHINPLL